jgi:hypothetical protein
MEFHENPLNGTRGTADQVLGSCSKVPLTIDTSWPNIHCCKDGGGVLGLEFQGNLLTGRSDTAQQFKWCAFNVGRLPPNWQRCVDYWCEVSWRSLEGKARYCRVGSSFGKLSLIIDRSEPNFHRSYCNLVNCDVHISRKFPHWQTRYSREVTWQFKFDIWYKHDY